MKNQINPTVKAHLIRSAFYVLLLLAVCAIPFALAQRNATKRSMTNPNAVAIAQLPQDTPSLDGTVRASRVRAPAATDLADTLPLTNSPIVCGETCTSYNFTLGTATFVPGVTDTGNHCDDCLTSITLPFSVNLYDQSFTTASVGSNGALFFGTANASFAVTCSPLGLAGTTYTMGPYWTDQCTGACGSTTCTNCGIFTTTTGTAPNRIFYIEYRTNYFSQSTVLDYEVALNENGSPPFQYIYNTINAASAPNDSKLVVGVKKDDTTFTQYGCDTTGGTNPPVQPRQALTAQCVPASRAGRWQTEPSMLAARAFASGAVASNAFYVLAGYNGTTPYVTETDFFNGTTWATGAPIPTPHSLSRAAAVGNNIYVPGGFNSVSFGGPLNFMQIYNTTANTWSNGMNLPAALAGPAVAAFNGKVYIIGGFTTPFPTATSAVYKYDPVANTYATKTSMPAASGNIAAAVIGNEIFVVGGSSPTTVAYAYNPTTDTWRPITAPSPADCQAGGAFALNGQLWLVGCLGQTGTNSKIYNPVSDSWSAGPPLNTSQEGGSATSIYNALGFVAGGGVGGAASTTVEAVHNGKPDYVLYNGGTRQTAVWYMNNNVFAGSAFGPTLPAGWNVIDVADFNGDGNPDYALFNPTTRQTAIWYLSGVTFIGSAYGPTLPSGWALVATGDFNDDCKPDYVLYNPSTRQTAIWYLNNNIFVSGAFGPTLPTGWNLAGVADFNGDGNRDYLLFNGSTRQTAIWYLFGVTFVGSAYGPTIASGYQLQGTADFNGDGKPDYLLYNPSTRQTAIWYLNNNTFISGAYGPTLPSGWNLVAP